MNASLRTKLPPINTVGHLAEWRPPFLAHKGGSKLFESETRLFAYFVVCKYRTPAVEAYAMILATFNALALCAALFGQFYHFEAH